MSKHAPKNDPDCIAVDGFPRHFGAARGKNQLAVPEGNMKMNWTGRTRCGWKGATRLLMGALIGLAACTGLWGQTQNKEQCSLAIVSRLVGKDTKVCDG